MKEMRQNFHVNIIDTNVPHLHLKEMAQNSYVNIADTNVFRADLKAEQAQRTAELLPYIARSLRIKAEALKRIVGFLHQKVPSPDLWME